MKSRYRKSNDSLDQPLEINGGRIALRATRECGDLPDSLPFLIWMTTVNFCAGILSDETNRPLRSLLTAIYRSSTLRRCADSMGTPQLQLMWLRQFLPELADARALSYNTLA